MTFIGPRTFLFLVVLAVSLTATAEPVDFKSWLAELRVEAAALGISPSIIEQTLIDLEPDPRVIDFDRRQPEFVQTFDQYLTERVTKTKISQGRQYLVRHKQVLKEIGAHYGVEPRYIVAFWGLESSFGRHQGNYSVIRSLVTLAHDTRRSAFFRRELLYALQILEEGHVEVARLLGGWAGAMGQNQFMPSSFLTYAQDFDGDGKKNIWQSEADVWASIANYLHKNGWKHGENWGFKVRLPGDLTANINSLKPIELARGCRALRSHTLILPLAAWQEKGVKSDSGTFSLDGTAALIYPEKGSNISYLVHSNFRVVLSCNCANKYAVSVGLMADSLSSSGRSSKDHRGSQAQ